MVLILVAIMPYLRSHISVLFYHFNMAQNLFGVDQYSPKRSPSPEGCLDGTSHGSRSASTDSAPESTPDASPTGFLTGSTGGCSTASRRRGEVSCH